MFVQPRRAACGAPLTRKPPPHLQRADARHPSSVDRRCRRAPTERDQPAPAQVDHDAPVRRTVRLGSRRCVVAAEQQARLADRARQGAERGRLDRELQTQRGSPRQCCATECVAAPARARARLPEKERRGPGPRRSAVSVAARLRAARFKLNWLQLGCNRAGRTCGGGPGGNAPGRAASQARWMGLYGLTHALHGRAGGAAARPWGRAFERRTGDLRNS